MNEAERGASGDRIALGDQLRRRRRAIARRATDEIWAQIPGYAAVDDPAVAADVAEVNAVLIGELAGCYARDEQPGIYGSRIVREAAVRRAETGIPLCEYLHAFRISQEVVWRAIVNLVNRGVGSPVTALSAAGFLMKCVDQVTTDAAEAFVDGNRSENDRRERVASGLLEDCLAGIPPSSPESEVMAGAIGLGPQRPCVVAVARPPSGATHADGLQIAARRLSRAVRPLFSSLVSVRQGEIVLVTVLGGKPPEVVARAVERARRSLAVEGLPLAIGMSLPKPGSDCLADAYHEARIGASHAGGAGGMVCIGDLRPFEYVALRGVGDPVLRELVNPALAEFIEEERAGEGALIATLEAYAGANLKARVAARRLGIHVNTMHYRLSRIAERTGSDVRQVEELMQLLTVVHALGPAARQHRVPFART